MKKFRNHFRYRKKNETTGRLCTYYSKKIRFFQSGEYGEPTEKNKFIARPHYHAIIFGHDFKDKKPHKEVNNNMLYTSDHLNSLWDRGNTLIGSVSFDSAAYVARYVMKKTNASQLSPDEYFEKYTRINRETGEYTVLVPEYATMSRGGNGDQGGIGQGWYNKYKSDAYPSDFITIRGVKQKPPKYYDYLYDLDPEGCLATIKDIRLRNIKPNENTPERLRAREIVKIAQTQNLRREIK